MAPPSFSTRFWNWAINFSFDRKSLEFYSVTLSFLRNSRSYIFDRNNRIVCSLVKPYFIFNTLNFFKICGSCKYFDSTRSAVKLNLTCFSDFIIFNFSILGALIFCLILVRELWDYLKLIRSKQIWIEPYNDKRKNE